MKNIRIEIMFLACIWPTIPSFGQPDSLSHATDVTGFRVDGKFRDCNKAWYINASGSFINLDYRQELRYGLGVSFEYKLKKTHSIGAGLNLLLIDQEPLFSTYGSPNFGIEVKLDYRYYHNLKSRMSRGLTGDNFNANYFLISPIVSFGYESYSFQGYQFDFNTGTWMAKYKSIFKAVPGLRLGYGIQRSIWNNLNFDINGGFQIQRVPYSRNPLSLIYFQFTVRYIFK